MGRLKTLKNTEKLFNVFIIDDSQAQAETLKNDLLELPLIEEVNIYTSCSRATLPLLEKEPDILFLDMEMPTCTGLEYLNVLKNKVNFPLKVVFYTAHSQYMIDALRQSAFDFLLKPYKKSELEGIINRISEANEANEIKPLKELDLAEENQRKIAVQTVDQLLLLTPKEVLAARFNRPLRSWAIMLTNGTVLRLHQTTTAEDLLNLDPSFVRINQGDIVNLNYLTGIENITQRCRFSAPYDEILEIYTSRRNYTKLRTKFNFV